MYGAGRTMAMVLGLAFVVVAPQFSNADEAVKKCLMGCPGHHQENLPQAPGADQFQNQGQMQNQQGDDVLLKRRYRRTLPNEDVQIPNNQPDYPTKRLGQAGTNWKFDPNHHERRHHRSDHFRFFFGGYWYPEPYWLGPGYYDDYDYYSYYEQPYRLSCGQGRYIVSERFSRVRVVECEGRIYTYLGHRYGRTFEVLLSSRSGRIVDVREI